MSPFSTESKFLMPSLKQTSVCEKNRLKGKPNKKHKRKPFTTYGLVRVKGFVTQIPLRFLPINLQQPSKVQEANGTACTGLYWSAFVFLLPYSPNSKMLDLSIYLRPTTAHALLSRLMRRHHLNRWIPDGCIGAIRYFSQTTDSGILFPVSAAVSEKPPVHHEPQILNWAGKPSLSECVFC